MHILFFAGNRIYSSKLIELRLSVHSTLIISLAVNDCCGVINYLYTLTWINATSITYYHLLTNYLPATYYEQLANRFNVVLSLHGGDPQ